jgi:hypothetical protein
MPLEKSAEISVRYTLRVAQHNSGPGGRCHSSSQALATIVLGARLGGDRRNPIFAVRLDLFANECGLGDRPSQRSLRSYVRDILFVYRKSRLSMSNPRPNAHVMGSAGAQSSGEDSGPARAREPNPPFRPHYARTRENAGSVDIQNDGSQTIAASE